MSAPVPTIETARLRLRPWRTEDAGAYRGIARDDEVMRYIGSGLRYRLKRTAGRAVGLVSNVESRRAVAARRRHWEKCGFGEWAVEEKESGRFVGQVGLVHHPDWHADPAKVEVGWLLVREAWGKGYATEAGAASVDHAFGRLGLDRLVSIAVVGNDRSERVMERLGFSRQGRTRWLGSKVVWYALDRERWEERTAP